MKARYKILTIVLALAMLFTMASCNTLVIDGSKITKVTMTLDFYNADGEVTSTSNVKIHLYENNAPKTVKHVKNLIKKGFYNGISVNSITPYFVELGQYTAEYGTSYQRNDVIQEESLKEFTQLNLTKKDYTYGTVVGEFDENGFEGQNQPINKGAIALKRDRGDGAVNHNSGTSGLYFLTKGITDIKESDYCFVGRVIESDGDNSAYTTDVNEIDRTDFSSFAIINDLSIYTENKAVANETSTMYYNVKEGYYCKKVVTADETICYKQVKNTQGEYDVFEQMDATEQEEFLSIFQLVGDSFDEEYYNYFILPYEKIVVRSMRITK